MDNQAGPKNYVKNLLANLMMKNPLPGNSTRRASQDSHHVQNLFWYASAFSFSLKFIEAVKTKGHNINPGQISQVDREFEEYQAGCQ